MKDTIFFRRLPDKTTSKAPTRFGKNTPPICFKHSPQPPLIRRSCPVPNKPTKTSSQIIEAIEYTFANTNSFQTLKGCHSRNQLNSLQARNGCPLQGQPPPPLPLAPNNTKPPLINRGPLQSWKTQNAISFCFPLAVLLVRQGSGQVRINSRGLGGPISVKRGDKPPLLKPSIIIRCYPERPAKQTGQCSPHFLAIQRVRFCNASK